VDEATYDGQIISSLNSRDEVVDEGFGRRTGGSLFQTTSFVVREMGSGVFFGM